MEVSRRLCDKVRLPVLREDPCVLFTRRFHSWVHGHKRRHGNHCNRCIPDCNQLAMVPRSIGMVPGDCNHGNRKRLLESLGRCIRERWTAQPQSRGSSRGQCHEEEQGKSVLRSQHVHNLKNFPIYAKTLVKPKWSNILKTRCFICFFTSLQYFPKILTLNKKSSSVLMYFFASYI